MDFIALSCQWLSRLAAGYGESGGRRGATVVLAFMTILAWVTSLIVYQGGRMLGYA